MDTARVSSPGASSMTSPPPSQIPLSIPITRSVSSPNLSTVSYGQSKLSPARKLGHTQRRQLFPASASTPSSFDAVSRKDSKNSITPPGLFYGALPMRQTRIEEERDGHDNDTSDDLSTYLLDHGNVDSSSVPLLNGGDLNDELFY